MTCCREFVGEVRNVPSPFVRGVATGYYDGPTDGLLECGACKTVYAFHILDSDDGQDMRVFSLARSPGLFPDAEPFAAVKNSSSQWTVLLLSPATRTANEVVAAQLDAALDVKFVVAAEDLCGPLDVWHPVEALRDVDWFAEFGLERDCRDE